MTVAALIVAAGRGERVGGELPKQYRAVAGQPLLRWSVAAFAAHPSIDRVRVVIRPEDRPHYDRSTAGLSLLAPVDGGATRCESVRRGLESLADDPPDRVLIHDGARPFVTAGLIERCLAALAEAPGAIAAIPLADSLKRGANGRVVAALDRTGLWRAQTPQAFRYSDILAAHRAAAGLGDEAALSDDAAIAERAGIEVRLVPGDEDNLKVTTPADLRRAERFLAGRAGEIRVGHGFDVHRFAPGRPLVLCGVTIPGETGLAGHSDADVALHALTDAILGALAEGDIGDHFPPTDPAWADAPSERFLGRAAEMVRGRGGAVVNVDVTVVCERPKLAPHREAMRRRIAEILDLALDRVSVKATTTERLGFTGRGEGIAAQATAGVRLPG